MAETNIPVTSGSGNNVDVFKPAGGNLRQAVVFADPDTSANIAPVQATDPTSSSQGIVVRDVNTSAIVARLGQTIFVQFSPANPAVAATFSGSMAVYFDQSVPTVKAIPSTGTFTVGFDPGHELGSIKQINTTVNVQLDPGHTLGAITTVGSITNTVAVFFSPANPAVNATFSSTSLEVVPTTGSRKTMDDAAAAQRVLIVGSQTNASLVISGTVTANAGTGTLTVVFDPGHTIGKVEPGVGTFQVYLPDTGHEIGTIRGNTNTLTVFLPDTGHEIGTIRGNTNTLTVFLPDTGHTLGFIQGTKTTLAVSLDPGYTLGSVQSIKTTVTVGFDPGYTLGKVDQGNATTSGTQAWLVNPQTTASIFTVAGSTSGISVSGVTLISPSANASFKVYAFSLQTTGQVSLTTKFTNGAGSSPTEFFRPLITASGVTGAQGANLATHPGAPLFVTGVSTTLALVLDSATLVHYSVSYTKESA